MTKRSVVAVLILSVITGGIYHLIWMVMTKREMVRSGADIPTSWLLIIPIANIYYLWKWCGGVERVTDGRMSQGFAFVLTWLINIIAVAIIQAELNNAIDRGEQPRLPEARVV